MTDHRIAALVNELRDIAVKFHSTQQLRDRISQAVNVALAQQDAPSALCQRCVPVCRGGAGCFAGMPDTDPSKMTVVKVASPAQHDVHSCHDQCSRPGCVEARVQQDAQAVPREQTGDVLRGRICGYTPGMSRIEVQLPEGTLITGWLELGEPVYIAPTPQPQQQLCWLDRKSVECLQGSEMTWMPAWNRPTSSDPVPVFLGPPAQRVMLTDGELLERLASATPAQLDAWLTMARQSEARKHRVMLTHEEISRIYAEQTGASIDDSPWALHDFARAVIEAYERKNQGGILK